MGVFEVCLELPGEFSELEHTRKLLACLIPDPSCHATIVQWINLRILRDRLLIQENREPPNIKQLSTLKATKELMNSDNYLV